MSQTYRYHYAKEVLSEWLGRESRGGDLCGKLPNGDIVELNFVSNRSGVFTDYPVCGQDSLLVLWDEDVSVPREGCIPTYNECVKAGITPSAVLDVAVPHKGAIIFGFIVRDGPKYDWRHISLPKRTQYEMPIYEISAKWIMKQVERPSVLKLLNVL